MSPIELAARWKRKPKTLRNWRAMKYGPQWKTIAGRVLYPLNAVLEWESR